MLVVKERMHALSVSQVVRVFPAALRHRLFRRPEPEGLHPRREGGEAIKEKMAKTATAFCDEGVIGTSARDYLVQWAEGRRPRQPRPSSYPFLQHKWQHEDLGHGQAARLPASSAVRPVHVAILGVSGQVLPDTAEEEADGGGLSDVTGAILGLGDRAGSVSAEETSSLSTQDMHIHVLPAPCKTKKQADCLAACGQRADFS